MFDHVDNIIPFNPWSIPGAETASATSATRQRAQAFLNATPSGRIVLAIDDLERAERSPDYTIDMANWHAPDMRSGTCAVCLAGAVLANRHPIRPDQVYVGPFEAEGPGEFAASAKWDRILCAIDELRNGYVDGYLLDDGRMTDGDIEAFIADHGPADAAAPFPGYVAYDEDATAFKAWALDIATKLEAAGH